MGLANGRGHPCRNKRLIAGKSAKSEVVSQGIPGCNCRRKRRQNPPKMAVFVPEPSVTVVNFLLVRFLFRFGGSLRLINL
jgi:hypothetical protein